jgi:hypothetical protein
VDFKPRVAGEHLMEEIKAFSNGPAGTWAAIASALIAIALFLPRLLNAVKSDKVDGNVFDRLLKHEERMNAMDDTIHKQQVKVTRLVVLVTHMNGLLIANGVTIPEKIEKEIQELTEDV